MQSYKTVERVAHGEFIEKKSRFIGHILPVTTVEQVDEFIKEVKSRHWQATHNCWAYILKDGITQRYSDDGEPKGTAGIPILEVLKKEEMFDVVVVVTRYYGGIMLGAGGLVRAYSAGAKIAIDAGIRITMASCFILDVKIPYNLYDRFLAATESYPMKALKADYNEDIQLRLKLRKDYIQQLEHMLIEISSGTIKPQIVGEEFAPI